MREKEWDFTPFHSGLLVESLQPIGPHVLKGLVMQGANWPIPFICHGRLSLLTSNMGPLPGVGVYGNSVA